MCKFNPKNDSRFIDPCIKIFIENLNLSLRNHIKTLACCCGHGKYPMTIIVDAGFGIFDLVSGIKIPRIKRFYNKDDDGFYYIPETLEEKK